ncbi:unnamed protein product [Mytilus edulis]|uniref:Uncharacterized protein n=1 Tax=Mytilus edulis TaxID=6550 RepID=A0A8S3R952_MYTED|nr:unnamed protein product [Mytilus edulis]
MKSLINNLPVTHCVAIHDFSENYKCTEQCEIQSSYFQKQEVSIHVTFLHRHAILEYDGIDSNENDPNIITEHFLVISPDQKHDHHFTHEVQKLIRDYLISISYDVSVMHEFTDVCNVQYKIRHCIEDISYVCSDLGYDKIVRNFFETSHARRPQDAAGGYIKKQADLSIIRGQRVIQSARNLYDFASENLCKTSEDAKCSRRIFRYIETINRNRDRYFKPVKENRKIHQVCFTKSATVDIRKLSCYTCENCVNTKYNECLNIDQIGNFSNLKMVKENADQESEDEEIADEIEQLYELVSTGTFFAVKADDINVPYYLVKANKKMTVLRKKSTDKWGITYLPGSKVIHGYYFGIVNRNAHQTYSRYSSCAFRNLCMFGT